MSTAANLPGARLRETLEGAEKFCAKCDEWWPADREFFFGDPEGAAGLFYCCKACYREKLDPRRLDKLAGVKRSFVLPSLFEARA